MRTVTKYLSMLMVVLSILVIASQTSAQTTLKTEGWETAAIGTTPPAGWAIDQLGYGNWISWVATGSYPTASPYEGARMVDFNSWNASSGYQNRLRMSTSVSTVGYTNITVDFAEYYQTTFTGGDGITIQWSTNGTTWTSAGSNWGNYSATAGWVVNTQALPVGAANQATLYIAFLFTSQYGYDVYLDLWHLKGLQTGNLTGTVRNCYTNAVMAGVSVSCGGVGPVLTNAGGVYTINAINTGVQTVTATFGGFTPYSGSTTIVGNTTSTYNFCMNPIPGILSGVVTNAANGNPVVGARVSFGTAYTYSVIGGAYTLNVYPGATNAVQASKEGFQLFNQGSVTVTPPATTTINIAMAENTPAPSSPFTAALNAGQTAVNLNWGLPTDDMVLIYDDGIQDNFAIWASGGETNLNAMKFTPISYPTIIKGFYFNIGQAANYPTGNAFSPVKFAIYNEVGGLPGTEIAGTNTTVTPTVYGWSKANFAAPVTLASGNFFIVMIQVGAAAVTPGIGIDTTTQQMRSYSKFGATPWIPGPGNFMIRAIVNGTGGPLLLGDESGATITASAVPGLIYQYAPATVTGVEGSPKVYPEMGYNPDNLLGYQVWRLIQTQEGTPALWTSVGTPTNTNIQDNSWPSLPCGAYRWAAKAQYTFNRWSNAIFSNVIGKCWTCSVTLNVDLSCDTASPVGAVVKFANQDVIDTVYNYTMTASGTHVFTPFWKGNYILTVNKFGYTPYTSALTSIMGDMTINVVLLQFKTPPTGLHVYDTDAFATWYPPVLGTTLLNENFNGGFATNGWVPDAGSLWAIAANGNPGNCAEWSYYTGNVTNYNQSLTSKTLYGNSSPVMKLMYDIHLDNYGTTTLEQMAVEVYDGTIWHSVANYDNSSGANIPYTTETKNITAFAPSTGFKIRFRAYGEDNLNIDWWDIDNVKIVAETDPHDPCIIGYNFYLNGLIEGFTPDTFYHIPPSHLTYGTFYHACVLAIYGSGYSTTSCYDFTSHFLCPPSALTGTPIESTAYLTWQKPNCGGCTLATYQYETGTMTNGTALNPGYQIMMGNYFPVTPTTTTGVIKSMDMYFTSTASSSAQNCIIYFYNSAYALIGQSAPFLNTGATYPSGTWVNVPIADIPYTGPFYALIDYYVAATPIKNYFGWDGVTPQVLPEGLGWTNYNGTFASAVSLFGYTAPLTFLQRANVCVSGKKDGPITTIDPSQLPVSNNVTPIPAAALNCGANANVTVEQNPTPVPDAPEAITLLGYHVYRNNVLVTPGGTIANPNTLEYYDNNLDPGLYHYKVDAYYNVAPFNPPSLQDNSRKIGPVDVLIAYGYPLPFFEPWDMGSFGFQKWTFAPSQGNWTMNTAFGNPTPCADFSWQPMVTNYDLSLVSPTINAAPWTCADISLDFDYKLVDRNATGAEKLDIDVLVNGNWINKAELTNTGSVDWTLKHIDITNVKGKAFKVRFRANGPNSADMLHWYVDNIHIYGTCHAPETLAGHQNQFTTTLTWTAPACGGTGPAPQWIHWDDGVNADGLGLSAGTGDFWIAARWTPVQIVPLDGGSVTKISFFPHSSGTAAFRARIWEGPMAANMVVDQAIPSVNYGQWNEITLSTPHPIDISQELWIGIDINQTSGYPAGMDAGPAVDEYGDWIYLGSWSTLVSNGFDENFNIQAYIEPSKKEAGASPVILTQNYVANPNGSAISVSGKKNTANNISANTGTGRIVPDAPMGSQLLGYNVYRTADNATTPFTKINASVVNALTYLDVHPSTTEPTTTWRYYVTSVFHDSTDLITPTSVLCEGLSDTITITFPAVGINDLSNNSLSIYPNPAIDLVNVVSTNDIRTIEVLNYIGQTIYNNKNVNQKAVQLNVASFTTGVYFVKVTTTTGTKTTKITVTH